MPKKSKEQQNAENAPVIDTDASTIPPASFDAAMGTTAKKVDDEHLLPSSEDIKILKEEVADLSKALETAQKKADDHWDRYVRKEAEYQNLVRRSKEDQDKAKKFAIERFAESLLDVVDGLERGLACCEGNDVSVNDVIEGLSLSQKAFLDCLASAGIKPLDPVGENFNPTYHEALTMQESGEVAPNQILTVVQKGYLLHDRLLRPARVIVAKAPSTESAVEKK